MSTRASLPAAYRACHELTRRTAKNFYYAFLFLPGPRRRSMYALYAFCRLCDDVADAEDQSTERRRRALDDVREQLDAAVAGKARGPTFLALEDTIARFGVRPADLHDIIRGMEMDLESCRYQTFDELYRYCYHVAAAVGLASIEIFGHSGGEARRHAEALGIGMQLVNILRDVKEDAALGRIYLPQTQLEAHGCCAEALLEGTPGGNFDGLLRWLGNTAREFYGEGTKLFPLLDRAARPCPATLSGLYLRILEQIERAGYNVVLERRVSLSTSEKLQVALGSWVRHGVLG